MLLQVIIWNHLENYIQAFKIDTDDADQLYDLGFFIKQNGQTEAGQNYLDNGSPNDKLRNTINHLFENDIKITELYKKYLKRNPDKEGIAYFTKMFPKTPKAGLEHIEMAINLDAVVVVPAFVELF